jgi:hypothetical protein
MPVWEEEEEELAVLVVEFSLYKATNLLILRIIISINSKIKFQKKWGKMRTYNNQIDKILMRD